MGLSRGVTGFVCHTVPICIHAWLSHPGDYRSAVESVIRCGGDADTTAAITGGIVGAAVGRAGIPDEWVGWFRDAVEPGTSTVVILADHVHVAALADEARRFAGAELLYTSMPDNAYEQLVEAFES